MNSRWLLGYLICAAAVLGASCEDDRECNDDAADYCSDDSTVIRSCRSGRWMPVYCETGTVCAYVGNEPKCVAPAPSASSASCTAGEARCSNAGMAMKCYDLTNGETAWRYEVCGNHATCRAGECVATEAASGIESQRCTADSRGVETTYADGTSKTETCLEIAGFEAACRTYSGGLVGCEMPKSCDDSVFSEAGTCRGNHLRTCDMRYTVPQPATIDCTQASQVCGVVSGKAGCRDTCATPDALDVTCRDALASRCVTSESGANVVETGTALCLDESTQVTCSGGQTVRTACEDGAKCVASLGRCIAPCAQSESGTPRCDSEGKLAVCGAIDGGYGYVPVGARECLDDVLVTCSLNGDGAYAPKQTNCQAYAHTDGKVYFAHCQSNYQGYADYDVCVPAAEGDPCGEMTNNGTCNGNTLSYCLEEDDVIIRKDCGSDADGYTTCSVYADYADCRKSCTKKGHAACDFDSSLESYYVTLCAPDETDADSLTEIVATSVCMGNTLYSCDEKGQTSIVDCAANGGLCEGTACVYPVCRGDLAAQCTTANALMSCQISEAGAVLGTALQTVSCDPRGQCQSCKDGAVVTTTSN